MRILLILPADSTHHWGPIWQRCVSYAPVTLTALAAMVPAELGATIQAFSAGRIAGRVRRAGLRGGLALAYNLGFRRITPRAETLL